MRSIWIFVRIHGLLPCLAVTAAHSTLIAALGAVPVRVGWFSGVSSVSVPLATLLPALSVFGCYRLLGEPQVGERWALRPITAYRWLLILLGAGFAGSAPWAAAALVGQADDGLVAARNVVGLLGLACVLRPLLGDAAWLCPAIFSAFAILFGVSGDGDAASWAWSLHDAAASLPRVVAIALGAAGLLATALSLSHARRQDESG